MAKDKIGVILWQQPPQLKKDIPRLEGFLNLLDPDLRHCIEFRHKSWFEQDVYDLLNNYNVAFCIISAPDFPEIFQITTDFAYIRWHGIDTWYNHDYSKNELTHWAQKIKKLKIDDVFGYFNNDYNAFAPKNCILLKELLHGTL